MWRRHMHRSRQADTQASSVHRHSSSYGDKQHVALLSVALARNTQQLPPPTSLFSETVIRFSTSVWLWALA